MTAAELGNGSVAAIARDPRKELVGGGFYPNLWLSRFQQFLHALPMPGDDLQASFGTDLIDRIMLDPVVSAAHRKPSRSRTESGAR